MQKQTTRTFYKLRHLIRPVYLDKSLQSQSSIIIKNPDADIQRRFFTTTTSRRGIFNANSKIPLINRYFDQTRQFLSSGATTVHEGRENSLVPEDLSPRVYEEIAEETLEALYTYFDEILESSKVINDGDVSYSSGVLTIKLGKHGTYVINKQTPNKQIWLSSPTSGPKRYDFINKTWIYRHDGVTLYDLLNSEIPKIVGRSDINFKEHCTSSHSS